MQGAAVGGAPTRDDTGDYHGSVRPGTANTGLFLARINRAGTPLSLVAAVLVCFVGVVGLRYVFAGVLAVPSDAGEVGRSARSRLKGMFGREAHLMSRVFRSALAVVW